MEFEEVIKPEDEIYLGDGIELSMDVVRPCPKCGEQCLKDLFEDRIYYKAETNTNECMYFSCWKCGEEFKKAIKLNLTLDVEV